MHWRVRKSRRYGLAVKAPLVLVTGEVRIRLLTFCSRRCYTLSLARFFFTNHSLVLSHRRARMKDGIMQDNGRAVGASLSLALCQRLEI